jgi:type VII secretion protein EccB
MKSRRDQVQAYFFIVGRLAAAVTHGKPDVLHAPTKRITTGIVFGLLLSALMSAIFGIYGLFVPGNDTSWRQAGAIVMDKTTGARYVYLDGQLRPVLNYSSARLAAGQQGGAMLSVSASSLSGTPVGQPIGIVGAPDALPDPAHLYSGPWTVCVQPADPGAASAGPVVTLLFGQKPGDRLSDARALLVSTPDGSIYLIWQGKRLRVADPTVLTSLGYGGAHAVPVTPAWLNPISQGPDLAVPGIAGIGQPGPSLGGKSSLVGQVYEMRNTVIGTDQLYLVRADGITPLSRTVAALLLAAPATQLAYPGAVTEPIPIGAAALTGVPVSPGADLGSGLPPAPPELATPTPDLVPCMVFTPAGSAVPAPVAELLPAAGVRAQSAPSGRHQAGTSADRVAIPAGSGVLARSLSAPGAAPGTAYLITEGGTRYPLAGADVITGLGYTEASAVPVPAALLDLLPTGPLLSTDGARASSSP